MIIIQARIRQFLCHVIVKKWSKPSFTIQVSGRQVPIQPAGAPMEYVGKERYIFSDDEENNRRLSAEKIDRIQTFPDWYEFSRGSSSRNDNAKLNLVYKKIGNAIPVRYWCWLLKNRLQNG